MRDFGEYLRAYRAYVSTNLGWRKALMIALVWLAGMFAPLWAKTLVQLPNWVSKDAWLGVAWLYFCALRNVETQPHSNSKIRSARP
jgi:hypothetical protein